MPVIERADPAGIHQFAQLACPWLITTRTVPTTSATRMLCPNIVPSLGLVGDRGARYASAGCRAGIQPYTTPTNAP